MMIHKIAQSVDYNFSSCEVTYGHSKLNKSLQSCLANEQENVIIKLWELNKSLQSCLANEQENGN